MYSETCILKLKTTLETSKMWECGPYTQVVYICRFNMESINVLRADLIVLSINFSSTVLVSHK